MTTAVTRMLCFSLGLGLAPLRLPAAAPPSNVPPASVQIPVELRRGDLLVRGRINGSEPLTFHLDTGFSVTTIHPDLIAPLKLRRAGRVIIAGIAGDEEARTYEGVVFDFGGWTYSPRRVAAQPSDARQRWRSQDGILGAGLFRRFVVEIDSKTSLMRLHEPADYQYRGSGEIIPLEFRKEIPLVTAKLILSGRPAVEGRFEIDTGCDGCLCLGAQFVEAHQLRVFADATNSGVRYGVGGDARIQSGRLPELQLGKLRIQPAPANFFLQGSPVDDDLAGHIGLDALRHFKFTFDYARRRLILEP